LENKEIVMIAGDGRKGWKDGAPYDVIHVGAAAPEIPQALVDMLKAPGR
jgi:protein-L-isoaspartate(D-aspartate) O-methyltransferase